METTKEDFENKLLEDLLTGKVEEYVYGYIQDNIEILQEHKDYFRQYFLNDPYYAYRYAIDVDNGPRDDTRQGVCKDPFYAYRYAILVDKYPRDDTRQGACKDPAYAYLYARYVDKCSRDDTFNAVKGSAYEEDYLRDIKKTS